MSIVKFNGINQINTYGYDERFYENGGAFQPSVTHILHKCWPDKDNLIKWTGEVGLIAAEKIRDEAATVGTYVHDKIEFLLEGHSLETDIIRRDLKPGMAMKAMRCLSAFLLFAERFNLRPIRTEFPVWGDGYAGTADCLADITHPKEGEMRVILDWKTSKSIRPEMKAQLALYGKPIEEEWDGLAVLHLGNTTKAGFTYSPVKNYNEMYDKGIAVVKLFHLFYPNAHPRPNEFPEVFKISR